MPVTWHEAVDLVDQARQYDSVLIQRMVAVRSHYNADVVTPTFDVPGEEEPARSPNPLLIADAIDTKSMRAASVMPSIELADAPTDAGRRRIRARKTAIQHTWHRSGLKEVGIGRAFKQYFGYGTFNFLGTWDEKYECPILNVRDPLTTYSEQKAPEDFSPPSFVAYVYGKSATWIQRNYPETAHEMFRDYKPRSNDIWDVLEYVDEDQIMIGVLGQRQPFYYTSTSDYLQWRHEQRGNSMMLRRWNNRAGMVPGYVARRVTLDRVESNVMKLTGLVNEIGYMRTLEKIAAERGIFPDMVAFGDNENPPYLVNGYWADGRDGELNTLANARGFQAVRMDVSHVSTAITDRMEGSFAQSGELDPMTHGESRGASLRTGRALSTMAGFSLDPVIQEAQNVMARCLSVADEGILELWRGYGGNKKFYLYSGQPGDQENVPFQPRKDITSTNNHVFYPLPGADITNIQSALGIAQQTDMMSKRTARARNPLIHNEDQEEKQIVTEQMETVLLQSMLQQAANPQGGATLVDFAEMIEQYEKVGDLKKAIKKADEKARERQANQAPTPEEAVGGLDPSNPAAQAQPAPQGFAAGPTERGNQLRQVMRNMNARPVAANRLPARAGQ